MTIYILRSPDRKFVTYDTDYLYSPTDGKIHDINMIDKNTIRIVYYLNLLTNHTQYFPIDSKVLSIKKYKGKNYVAYSINSDKNSNIETVLYNKKYDFVFKITQRTGIIARRLINYTKINNEYKCGHKLGFITLGSRVDIDIPINVIDKILLNIGDEINGVKKIIKLR